MMNGLLHLWRRSVLLRCAFTCCRVPGPLRYEHPADIEGKRVLDVCCRKGKGAFALADAVGPSGYVIGVDPDTDNVAAACAAAPKNHRLVRPGSITFVFRLRPRKPFPGLHRSASFAPGLYQQRFEPCVVVARRVGRIRRVLAPGEGLWVAQGVFAVGDLDAQGGPAVDRGRRGCGARK